MKSLDLKYIYKFSMILAILGWQNFSISQTCNLVVNSPSPTQVCPGTVVTLSATATVIPANQSFNFNLGVLPTGWNVAGGASFSTPCGPGPGGNYFWASTAGGGTPFIQTAGFDICTGGTIRFDMRYAVQAGSTPCEGPDEPDEGVSIEYSLDGGATWIEFRYFHPNGTTLTNNPGGNAPTISGATTWTTWGTITLPIPPAAVSGNTMFRWIQYNSSGDAYDNWGIDNIFINASECLNANINWSTGQNGIDNIAPTINQDSCIVAEVYDDLGNFICASAPYCFTVFNPSINGGPDRTICQGATTTLTASGGSGFTWNNGVTNGVAFVPPLGVTNYTVNGTDINGCAASDQVVVTVNTPPVLNINAVVPVCINGGLVPLSATPAGGTFSGTGVTGTNFNPSTAGAGTHTITYTYITLGCTYTTTRNIVVNPLPVVSINPQANLCLNGVPVVLVGNPAGGTFSGTGVSGSNFNPTTAGVGTHTVTYTYTDGNGCTNSTTRNITVIALPTASTVGATSVCQNAASPNITFTGANGTRPYIFTYTINGGAPQTVSTTAASNSVTVAVPTGTVGTFVYALTGVQDSGPSACSNAQVDSETVIVNPLPTASTTGATSVCRNGVSPVITFTGANGTAPYTFTYTINGGAPQVVSSVFPSSTATVSVPTGTAGTFVYALTGVQDGSSTACSNPQVDSETIIVNPLPTASTSGASAACQNGTSPVITFTGANGTAPYTFTYNINGGAPQTVSSVGASSVATVSVPTGTVGTFTYALTGVQDGSSTACSNPQVDSEIFVINPLPTASTVGATSVCQNGISPVITFTGANGTAPYIFTYTINGGAPQTVSSVGVSSVATVSVPTGTSGTFVYALTGVQDGSSTTCSNPQADSETIIINPLPTASTSGATSVCQNGTSPTITFTGANGTAPYTFTYRINGGAPLTVSSVGASATATVSVPTGTAGTFVYALTGVQDASSTTCSNPQVDSETFIVNPLPTASTVGATSVCQNGVSPVITFTGANGTAPYTFTYTINGGGPFFVSSVGASSTATVSVPTGTVGTFVYALTGVQDASSTTCSNTQSDSETIIVNPLPTASTVGTIAVCQNGVSPVITFTGANGTAPYTFTYTINGGAPLTVSSVGASSTATVSVPTGTAGTFVYALTGVQDGSSTTCFNAQIDSETITVNPLPTASTIGTTAVCQNGASPVITFTGANGTAPYTFTYTINGGAPQTVSSVGVSSTVTVSVPTGTVGTFIYALTGVQDASSTTCFNAQVDSETITVNPLPTASTTGAVTVCRNSVFPLVTFTGANGTAPYTFTYTINGGAPLTVSSVGASSTATVSVPTGTAGTFVYALTGVQDGSSTTCFNTQVDSETIIVNPLPTASATGTIDVCQNGTAPVVTFTGATGTAPYTFTYNINGGAPLTVSSVGASPTATVTAPTGTPGIFVYTLTSVQDGSSTTCSNAQSDIETITVNPLPTASTIGTTDVCQNGASPAITFTGANGTAPYTFTYTINGAGPFYVSSVGASPIATVSAPTGVAGTFTYALTGVQDASSTTCFNAQVDSEVITVNPLPTASTNGTTDVCQNGASPLVIFSGANGTAPYTFTYTINGGAPLTVSSTWPSSSATVSAPTGIAGTFVYALTGVQDASSTNCFNAQVDSETITVNPLPTATVSGATDACQNGASPIITFTGANGTAPYTFSYRINNGPLLTVSSVFPSSTATVLVPTGTVGIFTYGLYSVEDGSSTTCYNAQFGSQTAVINPLPTASTSGTADVCQNGVSPVITFTGANGSIPFTFTYTINGGAPQTVSSVSPSSAASVSVPTGTAGTFVYELIGVQEGSATACYNAQSDMETIIVNPLSAASTSGTTDVCQNGVSPVITFTGFNGAPPYTFTYTINNGAPQTVSSVGASPTATVSVPTSIPGVYAYNLISVMDASSTSCSNPQVGAEIITINPLPTATTSGTIDICQNDASPVITFTGANGTAPYTFSYTINGGGTIYVSSVGASNTATVSVPTGTPGTYIYALTGVQDASSTTCSNPQVDSETVVINALPTASTSGTTAVCQDGTSPVITFTGASGVAPYTFTYTINGGTPLTLTTTGGSSSATVTVPTGTPGTYVYDLISVQDQSSTTCVNPQVDSETVTVNPLPIATIIGSANLCHNDAFPDVTFTGTTGTAPFTFTYTVNGGAPQTVSSVGANPTTTVPVSTTTPGTYVYELISVQDGSSTTCSNVQTGTVTVNIFAYPPINAGVDQLICENSSTTLNATNPLGVPFYWNNNVIDGVPFSPSQPTTYTVTADNNGCLTTDDVFVDIEELPTVVFSADTLQGCEPVVINFTSTSSSPYGIANCVWNFGDGNQYVGCGGVSNTFEDAGYYSVTLTVTSNNGCVNSATYVDYIYVEAYPLVSFTPSYANLTTLSTIVNYENTTIGGSTYVWNFGDGSNESTQVHPSHTFPDETSDFFTVRLIATSPIGCIDTAYGYVDVKEELIYYIPNTFTPDGNDYNETFRPVFTDGYDPYSYTMLIFNRWGETVWESHDTQVGWDGKYGGIPVQDGTYTWKIEFKTSYDDEIIMDTGHVNIIR